MLVDEERFALNGHEILLRNAKKEDAQIMIDYLRTVCGETRFLMREADEVKLTVEQETSFIEEHNNAARDLLILAFVDGEYAGNCSYKAKSASRRNAHRAGMGIALFQKYTGMGLGRVLMDRMLKYAKESGFEQIELTVVSANERAVRLYMGFGFEECGRIPHANKYDDGTYSDDIFMIKKL